MHREELQRDQAFLTFGPVRLRQAIDARKEFGKPCGRFRSPFALEEALSGRIADMFARLDEIQKQSMILAPGTPLNWMQLLAYLAEHQIIEEPRFHTTAFSNDRPKLATLTLYPPPGSGRTDGQDVYFSGHATADTPEEMMSKAVGEMLERHFLTLYRRRDMTICPPAEMKRRAARSLDVSLLNAYLPWQIERFPKFKRDETLPISWVRGVELLSGKKAWIPSQLVYWNYLNARDSKEPVLADLTTSGSGGHFTRDEAILSAMLEAIERDGFLIYWLNKLSPHEIDFRGYADPGVQELLAYAERYRLEMRFFDTTTDIGVPTLTCVVIDHLEKEPIIQLASCSGFNLRDIAIHAGREALMVYSFATKREKFPLPEPYAPFLDSGIGNLERVCIWRGADMLERFRFFLSGKKHSAAEFIGEHEKITTVADRISYLRERFKRMGAGYEVYVYEAKHRVLDELGYHVVRAVIPSLVPLYLAEHCATLDSKRLREVPAKLGFKAAEELNPWPHPFP